MPNDEELKFVHSVEFSITQTRLVT